jgi:hypothetical protein
MRLRYCKISSSHNGVAEDWSLLERYTLPTGEVTNDHKGIPGEQSYNSTHSQSRHWTEGSGQLHAPAALSQGKNSRYPLYKELSGLHIRS